ncbi:MAG: hypothetical protein ACKOB4_14775 [Acidobacteriota bacterium]
MLSNKIKAQLMLIATFVLGMAIGVTGYHLYLRHFNGNGTNEEALLKDLSRTLELSPPQRQKVEEILTQTRGEYQELRNKNRPEFHAVRDRMRRRIKEVLSAEQQGLYDEWNRQQDEKRDQQRGK